MRQLLTGVKVIELKRYKDNRGSFLETHVQEREVGLFNYPTYVQDNESTSKKNVLRGLHYQTRHAQAKLIRVVRGKILDVCVDLNKQSPNFLDHYSIELSSDNDLCLFVPGGYAHGFLSLENDTIVSYKCNDYYYPKEQGGIIWNDKDIKIDWGILEKDVILSEKDSCLPIATKALNI